MLFHDSNFYVIAGSQTQSQRLKAMEKLKEFKCRVLISTDLVSWNTAACPPSNCCVY